jgi:hypothetical protein
LLLSAAVPPAAALSPTAAPLSLSAPSPLPSPPPLRTQHQADWDLCRQCRKHYHQKHFFNCWFCNFK